MQQVQRITLISRNVYGQDKLYPACDHGRTLCQIAGTKTMTDECVFLARKLGYEVRIHGGFNEMTLEPITV